MQNIARHLLDFAYRAPKKNNQVSQIKANDKATTTGEKKKITLNDNIYKEAEKHLTKVKEKFPHLLQHYSSEEFQKMKHAEKEKKEQEIRKAYRIYTSILSNLSKNDRINRKKARSYEDKWPHFRIMKKNGHISESEG